MRCTYEKIFKIVLIVGLVTLALLDLLSFIGIIFSLVEWDYNILSVACSVFTAATSSILTIVALIMTFYFQKKDYENKFNEQQLKNRNAINKVLDTLNFQSIFIKKFLVPHPITQINKSGDEHKDNLKLTFEFHSECLHEIQNISISYMKLVCDYFVPMKKSFIIRFDENSPKFFDNIERKNNTFRLNIITGINLENYKSFTKYLDKLFNCALRIDMAINVLHNNGECVNKEIKAEKMVLSVTMKRKTYIYLQKISY